jgi:hypothetical protein
MRGSSVFNQVSCDDGIGTGRRLSLQISPALALLLCLREIAHIFISIPQYLTLLRTLSLVSCFFSPVVLYRSSIAVWHTTSERGVGEDPGFIFSFPILGRRRIIRLSSRKDRQWKKIKTR